MALLKWIDGTEARVIDVLEAAQDAFLAESERSEGTWPAICGQQKLGRRWCKTHLSSYEVVLVWSRCNPLPLPIRSSSDALKRILAMANLERRDVV